ncbi:hypothetical protein [Candidatus Mycobacterium methanotrophicum]|uniref:Uncharacterized protein n=1 Tax=Candidatus Mycobacterium methanotrophicum TaxID=2943498 RepID=A0ABY4QQX6_9MYCO|nr:hypothetical protein [Candidatus Mycobacterium methanotrophicum]UQX13363.1 hypothetical protein M5I08_16245 [Candidatus Mycobacterium methanotrophicum]
MGYSRSRIFDADRPARVLALTAARVITIGSYVFHQVEGWELFLRNGQ